MSNTIKQLKTRQLKTKEVAKLLECNTETIRRFVRRGRLTPTNLDNRKEGTPWLFNQEDIVRLPRPGTYYQLGAVYKKLLAEGIAPQYKTQKTGNIFVQRLIRSGKLAATQFELNDYWLVDERDLRVFINNHKNND